MTNRGKSSIFKLILFIPLLILIATLSACSNNKTVSIYYGTSKIYSHKDMDKAIKIIMKKFSTWDGCELHSIKYDSDDCNSEDNIRWMNELSKGKNYDQCIEFLSDFHSPKEGGGAWEPDEEYTDWQWWLAQSEGGNWELLTWGFG